MNYEECAKEIVKLSGGTENIESVTHCATRLRMIVKDFNEVDMEGLKKVQGVYGVVNANGQLQVVLAGNLIPVFNAVTKLYDFSVGAPVDENIQEDVVKEKLTVKSAFQKCLEVLIASVSPVIPALIAGGMIKVFLIVITLISAGFSATQTYTLLSILADAPFYFLPIFVAYGAAKKLGGNVTYTMLLAAALISPTFIEMVTAGEAVHIIGLPVTLVRYSSSLFPALFGAVAVKYFEKLFDRIIPGMFKTIFVGALTLICSYIVTIVFLAPLGNNIGVYVMAFLVWLQQVAGPFANAFMTGVTPFLVMTGMHSLTSPFMVQSQATIGYDSFFRPSLLLYNIAIGGACLGFALKNKDKTLKSEAFSCALSSVLGVSEPALFGFALRFKKPLIATVVAGVVGGFIAGLTGVKAFSIGYSSILALPIFESTMTQMAIAIAVTFIVGAVVSYILSPKTEEN